MNSSSCNFSLSLSGLGVLGVFRGALLCVFLLAGARAEIKVGGVFPALASVGLVGEVPDTKDKILVVDFWASWCAPCKAAFPALGKINADYAARGVVLVGISVDEKPAAYADFVKKMAPTFLTLHDASQKLVRAVAVPAMPTTYLIGRDGKVRFIHAGYQGESTDRILRTQIDKLLAAN
ncbi:MAG: TlpA family protein disulfide reductase [Opitutaceae bacterium]|nr:TlpA family protein disulfide reductase [Opitutaceae bacterium]